MFFFGWGTTSKAWKIDEDHALVASWRYFHFFWCPIGFGTKWMIVGDSRSEDKSVTFEEVQKLFPTDTPKVSLWSRFGLLMAIAVIVLINLFSSLKN